MDPAIKEFYASVDWSGTDFSEVNDELADHVLGRLGALPGKRILDLGCGSASLGVELACRGFDVVGLDLHAAPARARAKTRGVPLTLIERDMVTMDFRREFDAVVNWDISGIGLLPSDEENVEVIRLVYESLVPAGKFLVETYNPRYIQDNPEKVESLVFDPKTKRCVPKRPGLPSIRLFFVAEWQTIVADVGFELRGIWRDLTGHNVTACSRTLVLCCMKPARADDKGCQDGY